MGGDRAKSENVDNPVKDEAIAGKQQWSVLRDDFMTNRKLTTAWDAEEDDSGDEIGAQDNAMESD